jgi:sarcosine oxidase
MSVDCEVIVLGAGAMGGAAAYQLARAGVSVLLLEQYEVGHTRGASHGESRIIRLSYDHPHYIEMCRRSYRLWAELESDAGETVLTRTGMLDLSPPGHPAMAACLESMRATAVEHEIWSSAEVIRRYPQFKLPSEYFGVWQSDAGILSPQQCVSLLVRTAQKHGAVIKDNTKVEAILLQDDRVTVVTQSGEFHGKKLIVSAGPWAGTALQQVGLRLPLTVTQESYVFFQPRRPDLFEVGRFPIFAFYGDTPHGPDLAFYGFPVFGKAGIKIARHHAGPVTTADDRSFDVPPETVDRLQGYLQQFLPDAQGVPIHAMTCLYTNTPDRHFVIDTLPGYRHVAIACGFSGHGFKFAVLIGELLADLVTKQRTDCSIELFSLSRFDSVSAK